MREVAVMSRRFSGEDALAYQEGPQDPAAPVNHVQKRLQKRKGVEVVFDPKSHKDFLTGFRQRKQKRRKEAAKQIEKKERQAKLQERAERRQTLREKLNLDQYASDSDAHDIRQHEVDAARPSTVSVHDNGAFTSVVTVEPLRMHSDSEEARPQESSSDADSEGNQTQQAAAKLPHVQATAKPALSKKQKPSAMFRKKMKHAGANSKKKGKRRKDTK